MPTERSFKSQAADHPNEPTRRRVALAVLPCVLFVLAAYLWLISIGTWIKWPERSSDYDQLATAFRDGQLSLETKPDPALLALSDPFDPALRKGVPFLSDASIYEGKYYLYFGPVPALILVIVKAFFSGLIGDQYLVFAFICGIFLVQLLFIVKVWRRFFGTISPWMVGCSVLAIGLISPYGWILGNRAAVHDAAIASGQFFFLAGLYTAFDALDGASISKSKGILTGIFWAASLGSRITQIVPIFFMMVMILASIIREHRQTGILSKSIQTILAFGLPLGLGTAVLGWYNWARFGSIFETGISYQLAFLYIQKYPQDLFSIRYIFQNLYNYLLNPPKLRYAFPYFWPIQGNLKSIIPSLSLPQLYYAEGITGLFYTAPFLLFALIPVITSRLREARKSINEIDQGLLNWLSAAWGGSFLCGFAVFLAFFWASERYLADFIPTALLLSVIGFWQVSESLASRTLSRVVLIFLACILIIISIVLSNLLAVALNADGFKLLNPVLWRQLGNFFRP